MNRAPMASAGSGWRMWLIWGALTSLWLAIVFGLLGLLAGWPSNPRIAAVVVALPIPTALVLATRRSLRTSAPAALQQTIVWGGMAAGAITIFAVVVVGFDGRPDETERAAIGLSMVAAGVIAAVALPVRRWLEGVARRQVQGDAIGADEALKTFTRHLSRAVPMEEILRQVAEALQRALPIARAEVWTDRESRLDLAVAVPDRKAEPITIDDREATVAAGRSLIGRAAIDAWIPELRTGRPGCYLSVVPIAHGGRLLGLIVLEATVGDPDPGFGPRIEDALVEVARQLGLALHNVNLDGALQQSLAELRTSNVELASSRARLVAAADEARRRIERDLHDGAQQRLVTLAVKLGLARQLLSQAPNEVGPLIDELRADVEVTLDELRELARGVYPPLLASRGLGEALTAAAARAPQPINVSATAVNRYGREIETAVYFCCLEAIQNASKHAGSTATIEVAIVDTGDRLDFTIADDGVGFDAGFPSDGPGDGLVAMADRLGAVGGSIEVLSAPGAGTTVRGQVPVRDANRPQREASASER